MGSSMSVTKTRYLYRLVSNNWYCPLPSSATPPRAFSERRATNRYSLFHPCGLYRNSHSMSASVFFDGFHSACCSSSTSRDVLRAEIEPDAAFFVRFDAALAIESRVRAALDLFHARRQGRAYIPYVLANLLPVRPVAVAQLAPDVFPCLGDKRQHRLITLLALVLRVVPFAPTHLLAIQGVHRRIGIQDHGLQLHIGRRPDPFAHGAHDHQKLSGDIAMQPIHESPESGLHR